MIPEAVRQQPCEGHVVERGPKVVGAHTGELVLYQRFSATEYEANGEQLLLIREADIMAVLEGEHERPMIEQVPTLVASGIVE